MASSSSSSTDFKSNPPRFEFTHNPTLNRFNVTPSEFRHASLPEDFAGIVVGALVFWRRKSLEAMVYPPPPPPPPSSSNAGEVKDYILLLQRSRTDSMPLLWEIPGGAADNEDPSLLYAVARELWEESGLVPSGIRRLVTSRGRGRLLARDGQGDVFFSGQGRRIVKYSFEADVGVGDGKAGHVVKLDPEEHEQFLWATREEVEAGECVTEEGEKVEIKITTKEQKMVILEGFRLREEERQDDGVAN